MNTEIVISHLCQSYGRVLVFADVSFTIPRDVWPARTQWRRKNH